MTRKIVTFGALVFFFLTSQVSAQSADSARSCTCSQFVDGNCSSANGDTLNTALLQGCWAMVTVEQAAGLLGEQVIQFSPFAVNFGEHGQELIEFRCVTGSRVECGPQFYSITSEAGAPAESMTINCNGEATGRVVCNEFYITTKPAASGSVAVLLQSLNPGDSVDVLLPDGISNPGFSVVDVSAQSKIVTVGRDTDKTFAFTVVLVRNSKPLRVDPSIGSQGHD